MYSNVNLIISKLSFASTMNSPEVSIIISCFNEAAMIEACIRQVARAMPGAEILIVHGGTDQTLEIARRLSAEIPAVQPIRNENDRGKGHAIKTGIARARGRVMAQFDADLQFFAEDLPALIEPVLRGECDLCLGSRFLPTSNADAYKPTFFRDAGNRVLALVVSLLIGRRVTDVTSGVKAWSRSAIQAIDFQDDRYSYEAEIVVRAGSLGQRIREVPVRYASRRTGESMHRNSLAVVRAGLTIIFKSVLCRMKSLRGSTR